MESDSAEELAKRGVTDIQSLILPNEGQTYSRLWQSWHFLQVYSVWGLRLPASELELKSMLSITNPGEYPFFPLMQSGNTEIKKNCQYFQETLFPQVISLARSLLSFSKTGTPAGENFFGYIVELTKANKMNDALEVVQELRELSNNSLKKSIDVQTNLGSFYSEITKCKATLDRCGDEIEKSDKTSSESIKLAIGDVNTEGSLANLQKNMDDLLSDYHHAKIVAATSATYAWCGLLGLIAAGVVASIYGPRAAALLSAYNQAKADFNAENQIYKTALATQDTLKLAKDQLKYILDATQEAIANTDVVRNAWSGIVGSLEEISTKVSAMIKQTDEGEVLKATFFVVSYCEASAKEWTIMTQPLTDLVTDPYIKVEDGEKSIPELVSDIENDIKSNKS